MRTTQLRLLGSLPTLLLGAALVVACGDDAGSDPVDPIDSGVDDSEATDDDSEATDDDSEATDDDSEATDDDSEATDDDSEATDDEATADDSEATDDTEPDAGDDVIDAGGDDLVSSDDAGPDEDTDAGSDDEIDAGDDATTDAPDSSTEPTEDTEPTDTVVPEEAGTDAGVDAGEVEPEPLEAITELNEVLLTGVSDLRGLTYSADGDYLYASGFTGALIDGVEGDERQLAILRLNADGTPDDSFGTDGLVNLNLVTRVETTTTVTNDGNEESFGVVELANGDIVVSANVRGSAGVGSDVVLVKLDADGTPVPTFGTAGVLRVDFGWTPADDATWPTVGGAPSDTAYDLRLDTSSGTEKLVIFGHGSAKVGQTTGTPAVQRTDADRYILRVLASDGSFDPTFNGGVPYTLNTGGILGDNGRRGSVAADGSILSAGYTNLGDGVGNHVVAISLLPNGTPDASFGFGIAAPGVVRTNPFIDDGGVAECYTVGVQSNGRFVTTGYGRATAAGVLSGLGWETTDAVDLVSVGFTATGIDTTYGHSGTVAIQSELNALGNTEDRGRDLIVLPDDRVVHVGRFGTMPAIFVTLPDGSPDESVGLGGRFEYTPLTDPTSHFFKAAASPDLKFIAATTNNHAEGVLIAILQVGE